MRETPLKYRLKDSSEREVLHLLVVPKMGTSLDSVFPLTGPLLILTRSMFNLIQIPIYRDEQKLLFCIKLVLILSQAVCVPVQGVSLASPSERRK